MTTPKTCAVLECGTPVGRHGAKGFCPYHYRRWARYGDPTFDRPVHTECTEDECHEKPRSKYATLCAMHYHRQYRHGNTNSVSTGVALSTQPRKYKTAYRPDHPLANKRGGVYLHRVILYEKVGPTEQRCHWCRRTVHWFPELNETALVADHLDGNRMNNDPENLEPSCNGCNSGRAAQARSQTLREMGFWSKNDTIAALRSKNRRNPIEV